MDKTIEHLAHYAAGCDFTSLTPEAVHEAKRRLIDSVACAAGAWDEPFCRSLQDMSGYYAGTPSARIWGSGATTSTEMAGFVNGVMVRYLDCSDTWMAKGAGHPSDMIPTLVAAGEGWERSGPDLITAIVVAYEIYCSLCEAAFTHRALDQATAAAVGAAAGAGRLIGLNEVEMGHAISLALASNLNLYNVRCGELSDWKGGAGPNGARNGLFAARLAKQGVTGPSAPVEGKGGLQALIGDFEWRAGLHSQPLLTATHLKMYPVCFHGQTAVDAAIALHGAIDPARVAAVHIETHETAYQVMGADPGRWAPTTRETADHSLPFTVAVTLLEGRLLSEFYEEARLAEASTLRLMEKTRVTVSPEMTKQFPSRMPARVTVTMEGGATHSKLIEFPKGHAANTVSDAELEKKVEALFGRWGGVPAARAALQALWALEHRESVKRVVDALCPMAAPAGSPG